jgi:hypothetical protein
LAIGFTLGLNVIFGGSVTGGSLNPARSFGPALIMDNFSYNWIYWVAPIMGGLIAAGVYKGLHKDADRPLAEDETLKSRRSSKYLCKDNKRISKVNLIVFFCYFLCWWHYVIAITNIQ